MATVIYGESCFQTIGKATPCVRIIQSLSFIEGCGCRIEAWDSMKDEEENMIDNHSIENRSKASNGFWAAVIVLMRLSLYGCTVWALIALARSIGNGDSLIGVPFGILTSGLYVLRGATALSAPGTLERRSHRWLCIGARITGVCFVITGIVLWPIAPIWALIAPIQVGMFEGVVIVLEWIGRRYVYGPIRIPSKDSSR
jgi:hypothetical protein